MSDQSDQPRDPEGVSALDDMLSQGRSDEVELREWYAARGLPMPGDQARPPARNAPLAAERRDVRQAPPPGQGYAPGPDHGQRPPGSPPTQPVYRAGDGALGQSQEAPRGYPPGPAGGGPRPGYPAQPYGEDPNRTQQLGGPGYGPPPGQDDGYGPPPGYYAPPPPQRGGPSNVVLFTALAVAFVVVMAAIGLLVLSRPGSGTNTASVSGSGSASSPSASGSASGSSGSPSSATNSLALPSGATQCSGGVEGGLSAVSGNKVTSCGFAVNVRDAYVAYLAKQSGADSNVTLKVKSPVTKESYTMTCEGKGPVTCRGGTNALVYLY